MDDYRDDLWRAMAAGMPLTDDWRRTVLEKMGETFLETGSAETPWRALAWARNSRLPVPAWVIDYLTDRANVILDTLGKRPNAAEDRIVGRALGFGAPSRGKRSSAAEERKAARYFMLAMRVVADERLHESSGVQLGRQAAVERAALTLGASEGTIRRALAEYEEAARRTAEDIDRKVAEELAGEVANQN